MSLSTFGFSFWQPKKEWLTQNSQKIYLLLGVLLVGALSFESGFLRGQLAQTEPLVVSIPSQVESTAKPLSQEISSEPKAGETNQNQQTEKCLYVGSRNSNKYHLSTCAVAKRIKPENKVCFASKEEAEKRGYIASCVK